MGKTGQLSYWGLCIGLSGFMAAVWGGVAYLIKPEHALVVAMVVFLVMFGVTSRGEGE